MSHCILADTILRLATSVPQRASSSQQRHFAVFLRLHKQLLQSFCAQALCEEACALMWALLDVNPAMVTEFSVCNLEKVSQRRSSTPDMWAAMLVSTPSLHRILQLHMKLVRCTLPIGWKSV